MQHRIWLLVLVVLVPCSIRVLEKQPIEQFRLVVSGLLSMHQDQVRLFLVQVQPALVIIIILLVPLL